MGSIILILGSYAGVLPFIAAALAAIWYLIQIYDRFRPRK